MRPSVRLSRRKLAAGCFEVLRHRARADGYPCDSPEKLETIIPIESDSAVSGSFLVRALMGVSSLVHQHNKITAPSGIPTCEFFVVWSPCL